MSFLPNFISSQNQIHQFGILQTKPKIPHHSKHSRHKRTPVSNHHPLQTHTVVHLRQAGICNSICDQCRTGGERWKYTAVFYKEATLRLFQTLKNTSNYWPSQGNKLRPMVSWVTFFGGGGYSAAKTFLPPAFFLPCHYRDTQTPLQVLQTLGQQPVFTVRPEALPKS